MPSSKINFSDFISNLKERINIENVINRYVTLKRRGGRFVGKCPFHNDNSPSLYVTPSMRIFKCFVCGQGGDVISFLQDYEKISFMEAVKILAVDTGLEIPSSFSKGASVNKEKKEEAVKVCELASTFFINNLNKNVATQEYLEKRGVSKAIQKKFQVGFALDNYEGFLKITQQKKIDKESVLDSGLIKKTEKGYRDSFVNRLIFPIWNLSHQIIAFGGRTLSSNSNVPKYINSPETITYSKSRILYGLNFSRQAIQEKKYAILVEGYMDVLSLFQVGIENVVATSGTALTKEHAQLLSRFCKKVVLFFDGDTAGLSASKKAIPILLENDIEVSIINLPKGEDPDSFALANGKEGILKLTNNSLDFFDFMLRHIRDNSEDYSIYEKETALKEMKQIIVSIPSILIKRIYIRKLAQFEQNFFSGENFYSRQAYEKSTDKNFNKKMSNTVDIAEKIKRKINISPEWQLLHYLLSSLPKSAAYLDIHLDLDCIKDSFVREWLDFLISEYRFEGTLNSVHLSTKLPKKYANLIGYFPAIEFDENKIELLTSQLIEGLESNYVKNKIKQIDLDKQESKISFEEWKEQRAFWFDKKKQLEKKFR